MNLQEQLAISFYKTIAVIDEQHRVFLTQHQDTGKIFIKKILDVYNLAVYQELRQHPIAGIPKIIEIAEEDKKLILIEEYVSGTSLEEKLQKKDISEDDCFSYLMDLCDILDALHKMDPPVIHRDIKPSNILITGYNRVILLDFNAAKNFNDSKAQDTQLLGTIGYAAPEQYGFGSSSPQTDIFALGVVFREMLDAAKVQDSKLGQIADTCTKLSPSERYASVAEVKRAILNRQYTGRDKSGVAYTESFLPPGFRTHTIWKAAIACLGYSMIVWLSLSLKIEGALDIKMWLERLTCLLMLLAVTFVSFNYRNIQKIMPLCSNHSRIVRYAGVLLLDVLIILGVLLILGIVEAAFSLT